MSQSNTARAESSEESPKAAARPVATFKEGGVEVNVWRNPTESKPLEVLQAGEDMLRNSGADIRHGGAKAFYSPFGDYIQMPPKECFTDEPHYYSTALHELAHWTGAKNRLNRLNHAPFGSPEYAKRGN